MSVFRSESNQHCNLGNSVPHAEAESDKWTARRSLLFVVGASCVLWMGIIYAFSHLF